MQEIPAVKAKSTEIYDQLRSAAVLDMSSQSRAFSDFLGLMSRPATENASSSSKTEAVNLLQDTTQRTETATSKPDVPVVVQEIAATLRPAAEAPVQATQTVVQVAQATTQAAQTATQAAQTAAQTAKSATQTKTGSQDSSLAAAKNVPVSREAFEEMRSTLTRLGLSDKQVEELSTRTQAGQLTWGQLVQTLAGKMSGAKQSVELSSSQSLDLQSLFQKLGFSPDSAKGMVADVAKGDGVKVLTQIQQKLSTMPDGQTLGLDSKEMATLYKALGLPEATANKLAQFINSDTTVAGLKGALDMVGQEMLQQRALSDSQDTDLLRAVGKVMKNDVDKVRREAGLATSSDSKLQSKDSDQPHIMVEVETPDRNDTKWFNKHDQQQQKHTGSNEDTSWREFLARVKSEDGSSQTSSASGQSTKDSMETLLGKATGQNTAQQAKAETSQQAQAKAWEKVAAPKLLSQVQEALLKDIGQGRKQMTLELDPANLGKLQVMLQVKGKEVNAVLRADDPETARMLTAQLDTIKKSFEDQGLKVQNLEVQTGLASRQDQQLFNADQHNQAQERQDLTNLLSRLRMLRSEGSGLAQEMQNAGMQAILSDNSLHVIA
ncbi:MAG: flagellar hook-length control protein FliK [Humidesulfovibrio sp.]|nr:flagellar hook-length control protein FliK [Humidesulfovibrio sp.]